MFHMTPLQNLIQPPPQFYAFATNGEGGILRDGFLRHGLPHGDGTGVYSFSYFPHELFAPGDNWALLELKMAPHLIGLKQGSKGRYVLKCEQGEGPLSPCFNCEIRKLWMLREAVPRLIHGGGLLQ